MPKKDMSSSPGNANIKRQGHTATGNYGSNPQAKGKGQQSPRDLKVK